jgi:hypothetical protein
MLEPMEKMKRKKSIKLYRAKLDPAEVEGLKKAYVDMKGKKP